MLELLKRLLETDTQNPPGNERALALLLADYLKDTPCEITVQDVAPGRANLIARLKGKTPGGALLLNGHLDTVLHGSNWSHPAGRATVENGRVYGRGASDMKSGLACLAYAFRDFARSGKIPEHDVLFAATCDEESGGIGASALAEAGYLSGVQSILIGEPTGLDLGLAAKGCLWLKITTQGRTSHGAYPERGCNALDGAYAIAGTIRSCAAEAGTHPLLGRATATLTGMHGGVKTNMVPDRAEATLDVRTLPGADHASLIPKIRTIVRGIPDMIAEMEVMNDREPVETSAESPVARTVARCAARVLGRPVEPMGTAFFSDASIFVRSGDFDMVCFGPGESAAAHTPDESVSIAACESAVQIYRAILDEA